MSDQATDLLAWLRGEPPMAPGLVPPAARDETGEYIARMNAKRAAAPNPLIPPRDPADEPPAPTGDPVADHIAWTNWQAARRPNPLRRI